MSHKVESRARGLAAVGAALLLAGAVLAEERSIPGENDVWQLGRTDSTVQWLVIHDLADGRQSGVYHVEVLERRLGDPTWQFTRLAAHMAVTAAALRRSVQKPLRSGRVYPEHFDQAFAKWKEQREAGTARVCETTVLECLKSR
jgi:hypothetical protein